MIDPELTGPHANSKAQHFRFKNHTMDLTKLPREVAYEKIPECRPVIKEYNDCLKYQVLRAREGIVDDCLKELIAYRNCVKKIDFERKMMSKGIKKKDMRMRENYQKSLDDGTRRVERPIPGVTYRQGETFQDLSSAKKD